MTENGDRPELPEGWEWKTLSDVAQTSSGGTPLRSHPEYYGGDVPWLKIGDLNDGLVTTVSESITDEGLTNSSAKLLPEGTLLLAMYGSIGKLGILSFPAATNQAICSVEPVDELISRDFLFLWFRSQRQELLAAGYGGTQANISQKYLKGLLVPVPPRREQEDIVNDLHTRLSTVALGSRHVRNAMVLIKNHEIASLAAAFDNASSTDCEWLPIAELGQVQLGRQRAPKYHSGPHMRPYLRVANVFDDRIDVRDVMEMDFSPKDFEKYRLEVGDILLNEGQSPELLGRTAMYRGEPSDTCFTNSLIRFKPGERVVGEFAVLVFRHYMYSGRFQRESRITTNIAHLSAKRFSKIEFPVREIAEQERIVKSFRDRMAMADVAQDLVLTADDRAAWLRSAVNRDALEGRSPRTRLPALTLLPSRIREISR